MAEAHEEQIERRRLPMDVKLDENMDFDTFANQAPIDDDEFWDEMLVKLQGAEDYEREPTPERFFGEDEVATELTELDPNWDFAKKTPDIEMKVEKGISKAPERHTPRGYQSEVFQKAKNHNVILHMNTGLGKTMCAAMLINKYLDIDDRKLIFFLAPQVPLVNQQARFIQQQCAKSEVRRLHGQMDVGHESWSHEDWVSILRAGGNVFVMTPGMLHHMLVHAHIHMTDIKLLIFDECHHAGKLDEYALIMEQHYMRIDPPLRPRIFGMSAPMITGNPTTEQLKKKIKDLERTYDAVVVHPIDPSKLPFDIEPQHQYWPYKAEDPDLFEERYGSVWPDWGLNQSEWLKIQNDFRALLEELGERAAVHCLDGFTSSRTRESNIHRFQEEGTITQNLADKLQHHESWVQSKAELTAEWAKFRGEHPSLEEFKQSDKVQRLIECLRNFQKRRAGIQDKCIILCSRRVVAQYLGEVLQSEFHSAAGAFLRTQFVISSSRVTHGLSRGMKQVDQKRILRGFRSLEDQDPNRVDVMVATSILEEGIDIPTCKLVIRFNYSLTAKTDIQSSGRARAKGSKYIHMVPDNEHDRALERIKNHHSIKSDVEKYTKFRQRDYKNWKPRKKACLNDFHNPLYSVNTGAFISEEIAYRKIHETYTRFDKEIDFQVQWRQFAETPFDRHNFRHDLAPAITGSWISKDVTRDHKQVEEIYQIKLKHKNRANLFEGEFKINKLQFKIEGYYDRFRAATDKPGFVVGEFRVMKGRMYNIGKCHFKQEFVMDLGENSEKILTPRNLEVTVTKWGEDYELDDGSVFKLPDKITFTRNFDCQPIYIERKKKKNSYYIYKKGRKTRVPMKSFEMVSRVVLTLPAIIPSKKRPGMEEKILVGPVRMGYKPARGAVSLDGLKKLYHAGILDDHLCVVGRNLRMNVVGIAAHDDDPVEFVKRILPPLFHMSSKPHPYQYVLHRVDIELLSGEREPLFGVLLPQACKETHINVFPIDEEASGKTQDCVITPIETIQLTQEQHEALLEFHKVFLMCVEVKPQWKKKKPDIIKDCLIVPVLENRAQIDYKRAEEVGSEGTDFYEWTRASNFIDDPEELSNRIVRTTYAYYHYTLLDVDPDVTLESGMCVDGITFREHYEMHHGIDDFDDEDANLIRANGYTICAYNATADPEEFRLHKKVVHVVPELSAVLPLRKHEHKYARYFPSLLWRLECMEVIRMGQDKLEEYTDVRICYPLMYQCLTTPAVDHEPDMNYERIEFMGDSVLLWIIARLAYNTYPEASPIDLSMHVNKRISNEFLAEQMKKQKIQMQNYIIGERFARKRWNAPGVPVANHLREQELSRNTIADCHEALIYSSFIDPVVRRNLEDTAESPLEDCRRLKDYQMQNPALAFVAPTDSERLPECLENSGKFVTKMMGLPECTLLENMTLPELPEASNREVVYKPNPLTLNMMDFCESKLREIDPKLERYPSNLAGNIDPNKSLEQYIDDKYDKIEEKLAPQKRRRVINEDKGKVRSRREVEPTILASGQEVVPNTTLPVPAQENRIKSVVARALKNQKIKLEQSFVDELVEKLRLMFKSEDIEEDLIETYSKIWTDAGYDPVAGDFVTESVFYRKVRRALLRTRSVHQPQFASRVTRNAENLQKLQDLFGYQFQNVDLLQQALIHTSINPNLSKHHTYQRMEFLGDAALGICVSLHLYSTYPTWSEGRMSHAKSAIVSNSYFARKLYRRFLSVGLKLEDFIVTKSEDLREAIREFQTVYFQEEDDDLQISLDINMTPRNERDGKEKFIYPKILGDVYEAIMGAVLLDSGWDLTQMWNVCVKDLELSEEHLTILRSNLDAIKKNRSGKGRSKHAKALLRPGFSFRCQNGGS